MSLIFETRYTHQQVPPPAIKYAAERYTDNIQRNTANSAPKKTIVIGRDQCQHHTGESIGCLPFSIYARLQGLFVSYMVVKLNKISALVFSKVYNFRHSILLTLFYKFSNWEPSSTQLGFHSSCQLFASHLGIS